LDFIFLLGGHDLEMIEIGKILKAKGLTFHDRNLHWGAKLSVYQDLFDESHTFVGIELIPDILPPKLYIEIDHHNENSNKESSLEQIMRLLKSRLGLKIRFTRKRELIAANDKGYIPAMLQLAATPKEISIIRRLDKKAQGVTKKDERLAEQSILENMQNEGGVTIVKSLTSRFSTITDKLFPFEKLLIVHNDMLVYYGKGVALIIDHYKALIDVQKAFHGGGENGFFGIASKYFTNSEILTIFKPEILKIVTNG